MAQPPLSRQIRDLERTLGVTLFIRPAKLTTAGAVFVEEARRILVDCDRLVGRTIEAGRGASDTVSLSYLPCAGYPTVPGLVGAVAERLAEVRLQVYERWSSPERDERLGQRADLLLTRCSPDEPGGGKCLLRREGLVALLPIAHPLAGRGAIRIAQLNKHRLCIFPREVAPGYYDTVVRAVSDFGADVDIQESSIPAWRERTLHHGRNFTLVPDSIVESLPVRIAAVPVADPLPSVDLELVWPADATAATEAVVGVARSLAAVEGWLANSRSHA